MTKGNPIGYANPDEMKAHGGFFVAFKQNGHYSEPVYVAPQSEASVVLSAEAFNAITELEPLPSGKDHFAAFNLPDGVEVRFPETDVPPGSLWAESVDNTRAEARP